MLKKIIKFIFLILLYLLLALGQFALINSLDNFWQYINIGVIVASFFIFLFELPTVLFFIFVYGLFLDLFSFQFFSFHIISLFLTIILSYILVQRFFTNKSIYSFLTLSSINLIFYNLLTALLIFFNSSLVDKFLLASDSFWLALIYQLIWGLIIISLFFNLTLRLVKKLKPFFLEKNLKM